MMWRLNAGPCCGQSGFERIAVQLQDGGSVNWVINYFAAFEQSASAASLNNGGTPGPAKLGIPNRMPRVLVGSRVVRAGPGDEDESIHAGQREAGCIHQS